MTVLANLFTGALLCNSLPHLGAGLQGRCFPPPIARPRGVGRSNPVVNVLWGFANLLAGLVLLTAFPAPIDVAAPFASVCAGALLLGLYLARHFAKATARPV